MTVAIEQLYRLLRHFEQGPKGGPALEAYQCSAGRWTIAFGCTFHPDSSPIREGDAITEADVYPYTEAAVERVLADVKRIVKRPLDAYQHSALCSFVFNLGGGALAKSTKLLPAIEAGRWEDAAEAMGEFVRSWGRREGHWHRQALLGLYIRRCAEGCLLLGLDWEDACNADHIGQPKRVEWQPDWVDPDGIRTGGRFFDVILPGKTEFSVIQSIAEATPLPALTGEAWSIPAPTQPPIKETAPAAIPDSSTLILTKDMQAAAPASSPVAKADAGVVPPALTPASGVSVQPKTAPVSPGVGTGEGVSPLPSKPAPPSPNAPVPGAKEAAPAPSLPGPKPPPLLPSPAQQRDAVNATTSSGIDPSSTKSMLLSRRFWGLAMIISGRVIFALYGTDTILKLGSDPIVSELVANVMVLIASSAWEYCGEVLHTWGRVRARRALR